MTTTQIQPDLLWLYRVLGRTRARIVGDTIEVYIPAAALWIPAIELHELANRLSAGVNVMAWHHNPRHDCYHPGSLLRLTAPQGTTADYSGIALCECYTAPLS